MNELNNMASRYIELANKERDKGNVVLDNDLM
jgi:hypothetical protein